MKIITQPARPVISTNRFPVIGIGASAGGLDAFIRLLKCITTDSGMAYVLVQHLDPSHDSLLPALLQKVTSIPVLEITDDIIVEPDHIYIIPSNKMLVANDGVLQLSPRPQKSSNNHNLPIDLFFTSLAEVHQSHAIGVVLSGTASDGTRGLKAIKDHGGITFAQDEASAAYEGMPRSAVQAGVVDFILPPEEIPGRLMQLKLQLYHSDEALQHAQQPEDAVYRQILFLLRIRKGTDFTWYKQTTIRRRILRRMALNKNEDPAAYLAFLRTNKVEQDALYLDLLIPVTAFFRDAKVFEHLCEQVFPKLIKNKSTTEPIRIWVAGCSSGEEAYSIAICLKQFLEDQHAGPSERVQVFATDISSPAIAKARLGIYTKNDIEGLSAYQLQEYFSKKNGHYQVDKSIRDMCVFAVHNFLKDPPFGKVDLVSCRNVLIYLEPYLQKKALTTFHYALVSKGSLLLGKSETVATVPELFAAGGNHNKLFTRKEVAGRYMHVTSQRNELSLQELNASPANEKLHTDFQRTTDAIILSKYSPAGVVVNEAMDIVEFRGNSHLFLEQAQGKPSHNLLKMAKSSLAFELRNILQKARKEQLAVLKEHIPVTVNGQERYINIEAIPLPNIVEHFYLVLFLDNGHQPGNKYSANGKSVTGKSKIKKDEKLLRIQQLENELAQNREDMRSITEDQEADNEELQSANEELLSGSEELQSLNEELETSKEELQASNEELQNLNEQLNAARYYAESIVATIREPLLVLDKDLRVKTANDSFYNAFQVRKQDTEGKLVYDLGNKQWEIPELRKLLEEILPSQTNFTGFEVKGNFPVIGERVILLNAREMTGTRESEKLILLALEDVTDKTRFQLNQQLFRQELEKQVREQTADLHEANESLQLKNQEIAISIYNKRFLAEFSERFSGYKLHVEFFNSLVQYIADLTHLDYVFVGKLEEEDNVIPSIQTIAITAFGKLAENIKYHLPGGPCEQVLHGSVYSYPENCRTIFPKDKTLVKFNVDGYIGYPLYDVQGRAMGLIAVMHSKPISDTGTVTAILKIVAKRAEMELERIRNEQILEINNEVLRGKNEELEKMNHELESFTYISSHDLQEPLRKIQIFATRILASEFDSLSDTGKDYFNRMHKSAMRMQTLIEDLLAYSHTNITDRLFEKTDLDKMLEEVKIDLAESIEEKNAQIEAGNLGMANISPFQFRQVMNNLLSNALKFSKPGEPAHIIISTRNEKGLLLENEDHSLPAGKLNPGKLYNQLSFTDNGIGFAPEYKNKIFEVFQRLHGKDAYAGTGIGLAIVKKIVENHNGFITASGEENKGARFNLYIPIE